MTESLSGSSEKALLSGFGGLLLFGRLPSFVDKFTARVLWFCV
jgi:hypothetical protein